MIDYVYLESAERRKFAQLGHEYLIEQVQFGGEDTIVFSSNSTSNNYKVKMNFNHPTKELVWALKLGAFNGEANRSSFSGTRGRFLCYTSDDSKWESALDDAAKNLVEGCVFVLDSASGGNSVQINGQSAHRCAPDTNPTYNNGQRVVVELVNTDVSTLTPTNLAEVNELGTSVYVYDTTYGELNFALLSKNNAELFDFIDSARVVVTHENGVVSSIECVEVRHRLNLTDVSIPVEDFTADWRSATSRPLCVHTDVTVVQPSNYGLRLDGRGNPVQSANIQLNGHDRFKLQEGSYFNYYQTRNHHTRTPADGVNVYSFALHPEKHQPSGTTNLSRIDSAYLVVNFSDSLRANSAMKLDLGRDTRFYVMAFSYNVLRVLSGMAGLAYSN